MLQVAYIPDVCIDHKLSKVYLAGIKSRVVLVLRVDQIYIFFKAVKPEVTSQVANILDF